jgi:hypothetical protein
LSGRILSLAALLLTSLAQRRKNKGFAQEDCDCLLVRAWQKLYEGKVAAILRTL